MAKSPLDAAMEALWALDQEFLEDKARLKEIVSHIANSAGKEPVVFFSNGKVYVHPDLLDELNKPENVRLRELLLIAARGPLPDWVENSQIAMAAQTETVTEPRMTKDAKRPVTYTGAFQSGYDDARIRSFPAAIRRAFLVSAAIFIALLCPFAWYWKIGIFFFILYLIGLVFGVVHNKRGYSL